ncbi:MAG: cysteine peptidase family C39 domain-containing protein [Methanobrevibacter sp.]|nr:cysteine peptidase family C39 domain-containing protein [Methanobrevibacter sp.]
MQLKTKFIIVLLVLLFLNIAVVSANDANTTEVCQIDEEVTLEIEDSVEEPLSTDNETNVTKTTPDITVSSTSVKSKDTLEIYLKNSTDNPIQSKTLNVTLNNKLYSLKTDSKGTAKLGINLAAGNYKLTITFGGDDNYTSVSKTFDIQVSKLKTKITESANFVVKGNRLYFYLVDSNGNPVSGKKVTIKYNGKTYTKKTNSKGRISIKLKSKATIKVKYKGDSQYGASSKKIKIHVTKSRSIKIGNSKLLTKGYLRVYIKINGKAVSKKVTLIIGGKKITKKANSEGIVVFKPEVKANHYTVKAKVGKYYSAKNIKCYEGNVKDPLNESIPYKNGAPDIDVMPANYVMGDDNAKYTLKKSQYREVLKRDSYCLFLNSKLTKYTFFKTKSHPNLNHIIKREKWNVIERAINTKLVKKNKHGYWPGKITVSLKGKSYKYPYVRDVQGSGYTCGPTSCSMCSQVLKNYVCEKYIAKLAKTNRQGTKCSNMIKAMKKNNMVATYFYKASFNKALNELKNGGAALVFHAKNHYVSILDISSNGKKVLVSNSYGSYDNIPTKWVKVSYLKKKFSHWEESLIIKLNYKLSDPTITSINNYFNSMGKNWVAQNTHHSIGKT